MAASLGQSRGDGQNEQVCETNPPHAITQGDDIPRSHTLWTTAPCALPSAKKRTSDSVPFSLVHALKTLFLEPLK